MRLWHFTSTTHLPWIIESGYIKTCDSVFDMESADAAPMCAWFLDRPDMGGYPHGITYASVDKTAVRIEVEVPDKLVVKWTDWAIAGGIDPMWFHTMVESGGGREAADQWRVVFRSVKRDQWVKIETRLPDGTWIEIPMDWAEANLVG